ncbi:MAG: hypothetical protein M1834_004692 [Cirrosporium novae-zelandiae]|nr:MAG: hypothetical protein M1834_004692 [Cirrosporium novae-zelandiae]
MASLQTIYLPHLPSSFAIYVALYRDLQNATFLREQLLAGNTDFEYALIDASMVLSTNHALAAVYRAANDYLNKRLKSRNVHSEIIAESFRRFGITDKTRDLLVIKLATSPKTTFESVQTHLNTSIKGMSIEFTDANLFDIVDVTKIKKIYKLNSPAPKKQKGSTTTNNQLKSVDSEQHERKEIEMVVIGSMALRGATNIIFLLSNTADRVIKSQKDKLVYEEKASKRTSHLTKTSEAFKFTVRGVDIASTKDIASATIFIEQIVIVLLGKTLVPTLLSDSNDLYKAEQELTTMLVLRSVRTS